MSDTDKLRCVAREIAFRRSVYPKRVALGHMTQREADYEIRMMEAIAHDYRRKIDALSGQTTLFPEKGSPADDPASDTGSGGPGGGGGHD